MDFFKPQDLLFFQNRLQSNPRYRKNQTEDIEVGQRIKQTIFNPTNKWAELVTNQFPELEYEKDNGWNISGNFKKYSWARLFLEAEGDQGIYFTLGVDGMSASLIIKIDRDRRFPSLSNEQNIRIDQYRQAHPAFLQIPNPDLERKNWGWLIGISEKFITDHLVDFKQLHTLLDTASVEPSQFLESEASPVSSSRQYPLNIILYGPPGTGKTFRTIDLAVSIIGGKKSQDHPPARTQFDQLRKEGQIDFVTFHQNYTYEDFVMGLRPDVEAGSLKFERHEGIFYKIIQRAIDSYNNHQDAIRIINRSQSSFEEVFEKFILPLSRNEVIPLRMRAKYDMYISNMLPNKELEFYTEASKTVVSSKISYNILRRHYYEGSLPYDSRASHYRPVLTKLWELAGLPEETVELKNYVLIIDEINRANMSRVFGELITLLEDDKRLGEPNELTVTLPSGESFAVPPNLYLIGTMNTADKSLALLDIALRRRFELIYQKPDSSLLKAPMAAILDKLNKAIRGQHKSADFLIGHAYLMDKTQDQLPGVFNNRVIPLLMEYFNGNAGTVIKVLAEAGVTAKQDTTTDQLTVSHVG